MGWYSDNFGNTPENQARDNASVAENYANSIASGGLSGYAADYASARASGASDSQAHDYATGNSGGSSYSTFNDSGGTSNYNVGDNPWSGKTLSKTTSNQVFFPDQSNYLNTSSWLQSGTGNTAAGSNSGLGLGLLGNTNTGVFIPTAKYTVDAQGNIIRTENTEEMSTASGTPTTNPETGINNNNYFNGQGFAYIDKYGFPHVVHDYQTALDYSGNGDIASYQGPYGGGYALGEGGNRVFIPMPGAVQYGNNDNSRTTAITSNNNSTSPTVDLSTTLNADRARALANMLQSRTPAQAATDTDYDALLRQSQGANYDNLTPAERAQIIQYMKILRGVA